jgi:hypothetical protein
MRSLALEGRGETYAQGKGQTSADLRDFESIPIFFSEEEIGELQADIDEHRSRRLAREGEDRPESVEQPVYSLNVLEKVHSRKSNSRSCLAPARWAAKGLRASARGSTCCGAGWICSSIRAGPGKRSPGIMAP